MAQLGIFVFLFLGGQVFAFKDHGTITDSITRYQYGCKHSLSAERASMCQTSWDHFSPSFNGQRYDFYGTGIERLMKSTDGKFEVQAYRCSPYYPCRALHTPYTMIMGLAIRKGDSYVSLLASQPSAGLFDTYVDDNKTGTLPASGLAVGPQDELHVYLHSGINCIDVPGYASLKIRQTRSRTVADSEKMNMTSGTCAGRSSHQYVADNEVLFSVQDLKIVRSKCMCNGPLRPGRAKTPQGILDGKLRAAKGRVHAANQSLEAAKEKLEAVQAEIRSAKGEVHAANQSLEASKEKLEAVQAEIDEFQSVVQ